MFNNKKLETIEGRFPELLKITKDKEDYNIYEIERGKRHGGVARISLLDKNRNLKYQAFSIYPMDLPNDEKIIKNLYEKLKIEIRISKN